MSVFVLICFSRPSLHQLSSMPTQSCKALSKSMPSIPQCYSPADLVKASPSSFLSPSSPPYIPGECSSERWSAYRSLSSSSSGIGTDSCPSPSNEQSWTSCADITDGSQHDTGWVSHCMELWSMDAFSWPKGMLCWKNYHVKIGTWVWFGKGG